MNKYENSVISIKSIFWLMNSKCISYEDGLKLFNSELKGLGLNQITFEQFKERFDKQKTIEESTKKKKK